MTDVCRRWLIPATLASAITAHAQINVTDSERRLVAEVAVVCSNGPGEDRPADLVTTGPGLFDEDLTALSARLGASAGASVGQDSEWTDTTIDAQLTASISASLGENGQSVFVRGASRFDVTFDLLADSSEVTLLLSASGSTSVLVERLSPSPTVILADSGVFTDPLIAGTYRVALEIDVMRDESGGDGGAIAMSFEAVTEPIGDCFADLNNDGTLSILDLLVYLDQFLGGDPAADRNADATVSILDLLCYLDEYLAGC